MASQGEMDSLGRAPLKRPRHADVEYQFQLQTPNSKVASVLETNMGILPEEILKQIFILCPLKTRCCHRRVSRYWKYLLTLPEVNVVAMVDKTCNPETNYKNGLLGPHVRVLIFDKNGSEWSSRCFTSMAKCISNIKTFGNFCLEAQEVVLRHVYLEFSEENRKSNVKDWVERKHWLPDAEKDQSGFPNLMSVTFDAPRIVFTFELYELTGRCGYYLKSTVKVSSLKLDWSRGLSERAHLDMDAILWPFGQTERDWVAKHAPTLREGYEDAIESTYKDEPYRQWFLLKNDEEVLDLRTADYSKMRPGLLLLLAGCIWSEYEYATDCGKGEDMEDNVDDDGNKMVIVPIDTPPTKFNDELFETEEFD